MRWILLGFGILIVTTSQWVAYAVQPWARWWMITPQSMAIPPGVVPSSAVQSPAGPLASDATDLMRAVQPWMGTRYLFGGNTLSGVDCSGFTFQVLQSLGKRFPYRTAQTQYDHAQLVHTPEPGDLVFFRQTYASSDFVTHVGFYVGDGMMISAAEPVVGRQSLSSPFWASHLVGYGRV